MADALGLRVDEAFNIGDELIDEEYAAKKLEEIEARPAEQKKGRAGKKK